MPDGLPLSSQLMTRSWKTWSNVSIIRTARLNFQSYRQQFLVICTSSSSEKWHDSPKATRQRSNISRKWRRQVGSSIHRNILSITSWSTRSGNSLKARHQKKSERSRSSIQPEDRVHFCLVHIRQASWPAPGLVDWEPGPGIEGKMGGPHPRSKSPGPTWCKRGGKPSWLQSIKWHRFPGPEGLEPDNCRERKRIFLNNIYRIDINRQTVEVTKLSLLPKVLEEENEETVSKQLKLFKERALPSLHENIKCGNSLIGSWYLQGCAGYFRWPGCCETDQCLW